MTLKYLYKYGCINEHSEPLFSTSTVWFAAPSEFNDPFECRPEFIFEPNSEQKVEILKRVIKKRNPHMADNDVTAFAVNKHLEAYKSDRTMNWEKENIRSYFNEQFEKIGLFCLTKRPDNILMWSHYANSHYGYCLKFEAKNSTPLFGEAQPVKYTKDYPVVDCLNMSSEEQLEPIFLTKYRDWAYEKECRIINIRKGPGLYEYPIELLKGVIFGLKMKNEDKSNIRRWTLKRGHAVKFYECNQSPTKFAIEINELK